MLTADHKILGEDVGLLLLHHFIQQHVGVVLVHSGERQQTHSLGSLHNLLLLFCQLFELFDLLLHPVADGLRC